MSNHNSSNTGENNLPPLDEEKELSQDEIPNFIMSIVASRPSIDIKVVEKILISKLAAVAVIKVSALRWTGLHSACHINSLDLVKLFANDGISMNVRTPYPLYETPLHLLLRSDSREIDINIVEYLIKHGADVNAKDFFKETPLHYFVDNERTDIKIVDYLLRHGADPMSKCMFNRTPFHRALNLSLVSVVRVMLKNQCNVNALSHYDETPLMLAVSSESLEMVKLLLANGADPNNTSQVSPLMLALHMRSTEIVKLFLSNGAYPNAMSVDGTTSLMLAAFTKSKEIVELLLAYGANVNYPDAEAPKVLLQLLNYKDTKILRYLLQHADFATPESVLKGYINDNHTSYIAPNVRQLFLIFATIPSVIVPSTYPHHISEIAPEVVQLFLTYGMTPSSVRLLSTYPHQEKVTDYNALIRNVCTLQQLCRIAVRNLFYLKCSSLSINEITKRLKLPNIIRQYLKYEID